MGCWCWPACAARCPPRAATCRCVCARAHVPVSARVCKCAWLWGGLALAHGCSTLPITNSRHLQERVYVCVSMLYLIRLCACGELAPACQRGPSSPQCAPFHEQKVHTDNRVWHLGVESLRPWAVQGLWGLRVWVTTDHSGTLCAAGGAGPRGQLAGLAYGRSLRSRPISYMVGSEYSHCHIPHQWWMIPPRALQVVLGPADSWRQAVAQARVGAAAGLHPHAGRSAAAAIRSAATAGAPACCCCCCACARAQPWILTLSLVLIGILNPTRAKLGARGFRRSRTIVLTGN